MNSIKIGDGNNITDNWKRPGDRSNSGWLPRQRRRVAVDLLAPGYSRKL